MLFHPLPQQKLLRLTIGFGVLLWTLVAWVGVRADDTPLEAGFAKVQLRFAKPVPLGGYSARFGRPSVGQHDPLHARALALEQGEARLLWVSVDVVGIVRRLRDDFARAIADELSLRSEQLVLSATHTHSGPGSYGQGLLAEIALGSYDPAVYGEILASCLEAARQAWANRRPARLGLGSGKAPGLAKNRRRRDGPLDDELGVIRVDDLEGNPRALVVLFAAHPTVLGSGNFLLSADFPGAMQRALESQFGRESCVLFINANEGDLGPDAPDTAGGVEGETGEFAEAEALGRALAERVKEVASGIVTHPKVHLGSRMAEVKLPPTVFQAELPATTLLGILEIGPAVILAVPGEPTAGLGLELKHAARQGGYEHAWIAGLTNDHLGYLVRREEYAEESYESGMHFYGPRMGSTLERQFRALLQPAEEKKLREIESARREHALAQCRKVDRDGILFLHLRGDPYERGFAHGVLVREKIHELYQLLRREWEKRAGSVPIELSGRFGRKRSVRELAFPWLCTQIRGCLGELPEAFRTELEGIAEGAEMPFDAVLFLNSAGTVSDLTAPSRRWKAVRSSAMAVFPPLAAPGQMFLAYNAHGQPAESLRGLGVVMMIESSDKPALAAMGWPGVLGTYAGMNQKGLAIAEETVGAPRDTRLRGMPNAMALRWVLENASTLPEAVRLLEKIPRSAGGHSVVLDTNLADARIVEFSAHHLVLRKPLDGLAPGSWANLDRALFEDGALPDPEILPRGSRRTLERYQQLTDAIEIDRGKIDLGGVLKYLAQTRAGLARSSTVQSAVLVPGSFSAHVAMGSLPATKGMYVPFEFAREIESDR